MVHTIEELDAIIYSLDVDHGAQLMEDDLSHYEKTFSECAKFICEQESEKFQSIQKILLKHLFDQSNVRSLFASDMYIFIMRLVSPAHQSAMCQIVMNMCRLAPPEALAKGAALINRIKNPVINFKNPKYEHILEFS